jgi:hypothetical protein
MSANEEPSVSQVDFSGLTAVVYENSFIRVTLLPDVGAKIVGLMDLTLSREWITQATRPIRRLAAVTDEWEEYDRSGWDECFPSIGGGYYPTGPWAGAALRSHGELWQRPWSWKSVDNGVATTIYGLRFPYEFTRHLRLKGRSLEVTYTVRNLSELPFLGMWSMHPLFHVHPGMRILLPPGSRMVVDSDLEDLGEARYRERFAWPWLGQGGGREDLSVLRASPEGHALKLFSEAHEVGRAALSDLAQGAWVGFEVDPESVPHFGVWLNEGRWPTAEGGLFHVALEPTSGFADNLEVANALGPGSWVPAHGSRQWHVSMVFGSAHEDAVSFVNGR